MLSLLLVAAYLLFVLGYRPEQPLLTQDILHSWYHAKAYLSAGLVVLLLPDLLFSLSGGYNYSVCYKDSLYTGLFSSLVVYTWVTLRCVDLFETVLLVLGGKRPLSLHVLHHTLLFLFATRVLDHESAFLRWLLVSNLVAQYCLYAYLSPFYVHYRPCFFAVCFSNLIQFAFTLGAILRVRQLQAEYWYCDGAESVWTGTCLLGGLVTLVLFLQFYFEKLQRWQNETNRRCVIS